MFHVFFVPLMTTASSVVMFARNIRLCRALLVLMLAIIAAVACRFNEEPIINSARTVGIKPLSIALAANLQTPDSISLSDLDNCDKCYIRLSLRFRADRMDGHPNLFQTSDGNAGIRVELSDGVLGVIAGNATRPESPNLLVLSRSINIGDWHDIEIAALNHGFVRVRLDDATFHAAKSRNIDFRLNNIVLGRGFDTERVFRGTISYASVTYFHARSYWTGMVVYVTALLSLLLFIFYLSIIIIARGCTEYSLIKLRINALFENNVDRRIAGILGILAIGDLAIWGYYRYAIPKHLAVFLGLQESSFPLRAPLFEFSDPFTDFTEIDTFPRYVSSVSWASPPAEQLRTAIKHFIATEWPAIWHSQILLIAFCAFGLVLHAFGTLRLTQSNRCDARVLTLRLLLLSALVLMLYPIQFAVDRGNVALHNTGFAILGAAWFLRGSSFLAAVTFDVAAISKITPVVYALSFIHKRRWLALLVMGAGAIAGTVFPTLVLSKLYGYQFDWMLSGQNAYTEDYAINPRIGLGFSDSLFSLIRVGVTFLETTRGFTFEQAAYNSLSLLKTILPIYSLSMIAVGLDLVIQAYRRRMSPAVMISLLSIFQLMAPPIIADYYLTLLTIPLLIFVSTKELQSDRVVPFVAILALLPKAYFWIPLGFSATPFALSIAVPINSALITILYFYIRINFASAQDIPPA